MNFLFYELEDCCKQHFLWDCATCVHTTSTLNEDLYYPNFVGNDNVCKTGGGQPDYMNTSPSIWMYKTLEKCCSANYGYNYANCVASGPSSIDSAASDLYYADWLGGGNVCRNDNRQPSY